MACHKIVQLFAECLIRSVTEYFLGAWITPAEEQNTYSVRRNESGEYLMGYVGQEFAVAPGAALTLESALWAGPKNQDRKLNRQLRK